MSLSGLNELPYGLFIGFILVISGLFFKLGVAPFHVWLPDIYGGSPSIITFFISIIPKISVLYIFFEILRPWYSLTVNVSFYEVLFPIVLVCSFLSILLVQLVVYMSVRFYDLLLSVQLLILDMFY